ncbi:MAG: AMP-binding protein [Deltaproteobacteria bacterium]|nr:AMP-binding protein [Deltaproteobacteria bacterium]
MNLVVWFQKRCGEYAKSVALIQEEERLTYQELAELVFGFAGHLQTQGIKKGDKVILMLPNCLEFVVSYFAIIACGATAVKVSTVSTPRELRHIAEDSGAKLIIARPDQEKKVSDLREIFPPCPTCLSLSSVGTIPQNHKKFVPPDIGREDTAVMIYTAGLSGKALGAQLTHGNLLSQTPLLAECFNAQPTDRAIAVIPFFHAFGIVANLLSILNVGGSVVIMETFTLVGIFATITREKVTYIAGVPRLFWGMLFQERIEEFDISSLRFGITGGCAAPKDLLIAFEQRFGFRLWEGYGLTEASPVSISSKIHGAYKPGSFGTPIAAVEAKIVGDGGTVLTVGQIGELLIKGPNVMRGYHNAPEATAEVLSADGWLRTGDLVRIDEEGYYFFEGLKKRMVITSGFNVYPQEVEDVLSSFPGVKEAVVFGKSDPLRGEIVCAKLTVADGSTVDERELLRFARKQLSPYKVPREFEFFS